MNFPTALWRRTAPRITTSIKREIPGYITPRTRIDMSYERGGELS